MTSPHLVAAFAAGLAAASTSPVTAQTSGIVSITQAKAAAGNVTPGDTAGFPVTITISGSYRLDSNLLVGVDQPAVYVKVPSVTLDLNGFRLDGNNKAGRYGVYGISDNLTVRNGTIQRFSRDGIYAEGHMLIARDLRLANNGRYGVNELYKNPATGQKTGMEDGQAIIANNIIFRNAQGITCQSACFVDSNIFSYNTYSGLIISQSGAHVVNNTFIENGGYGIVGNYIGIGGNSFYGNTYPGTNGVMMKLAPNGCYPATDC